jgi:hypothetical protein
VNASPITATRSLLVLAAMVPLCGCVTRVTLPQRQALDSLVGKSQSELVGELGAPTAIMPAAAGPQAGTVVLYRWRSNVLQADDIGAPENPALTLRNHLAILTRACDTAFQLNGGRVSAWSVRGSDCSTAPYPYLGGLKQAMLAADAGQGRTLQTPFLFNTRTGDSLVLTGEFQTR